MPVVRCDISSDDALDLRLGRKRMRTRQWIWAGLAAASALWPVIAAAGEIGNYNPVTAERLTNPEPGNWMLYRRTYDGQRYSPLDKINTTNVKNLVPAWTCSPRGPAWP